MEYYRIDIVSPHAICNNYLGKALDIGDINLPVKHAIVGIQLGNCATLRGGIFTGDKCGIKISAKLEEKWNVSYAGTQSHQVHVTITGILRNHKAGRCSLRMSISFWYRACEREHQGQQRKVAMR